MDSNLSDTFLKNARFLHEKQAFGVRKGEAAVGRPSTCLTPMPDRREKKT